MNEHRQKFFENDSNFKSWKFKAVVTMNEVDAEVELIKPQKPVEKLFNILDSKRSNDMLKATQGATAEETIIFGSYISNKDKFEQIANKYCGED